jgi:hypothetical protein
MRGVMPPEPNAAEEAIVDTLKRICVSGGLEEQKAKYSTEKPLSQFPRFLFLLVARRNRHDKKETIDIHFVLKIRHF